MIPIPIACVVSKIVNAISTYQAALIYAATSGKSVYILIKGSFANNSIAAYKTVITLAIKRQTL